MIQSTQTNPGLLAVNTNVNAADGTADAASPALTPFGKAMKVHCRTEGKSGLEIMVGIGKNVPLWAKGVTLQWRFDTQSFSHYQESKALMESVRSLIAAGMKAWGDAAPVKYAEVAAGTNAKADFEVFMHKSEDCDATGCTLASAFFPNAKENEMRIYPTLFQQSPAEQVETLAHEIGHTFGLRHYFARSEGEDTVLFGKHARKSIMNYNDDCVMTETDRRDLKALYKAAWEGTLKSIKDPITSKVLPIKLYQPFHTKG